MAGDGEPLVLVHGGWSDRHNWQTVAPALARSFRVVAYDRRGHGSSKGVSPGPRRAQEDDLAGLIESLGGSAFVAATSFGASIALGVAARRPDLVRGLVAHEPPLISVALSEGESRPQLEAVEATAREVAARVVRGDAIGAARQFVEEVALGPGAWDLLPAPLQQTMVDSAPAFVAEQADPAWADIDLDALGNLGPPLLLTRGDMSPAWFGPIVANLAAAIDDAEVQTLEGAGHAPHLTHPREYVAAVTAFLTRTRSRELATGGVV